MSTRVVINWLPAVVIGIGTLVTVGIDTQRALPLRAPLDSVIPTGIAGYVGRDAMMSQAEARAAGVTSYLVRTYERPEFPDSAWFSVYVGYYDRQTQGRTIHSPKNCLPGSGWEALASQIETIQTARGPVAVNRYLLQNGAQQALVLYWYQGRGRVQANEYLAKWDLLRDAALKHHTEEALVRIVTPVRADPESAYALATRVAQRLVPDLDRALPD